MRFKRSSCSHLALVFLFALSGIFGVIQAASAFIPDCVTVVDQCGICDGPGLNDFGCCSEEIDLGCGCGEPGPSGCNKECGSTKGIDICGVCGGDGSTCFEPTCVEEIPTTSGVRKAGKIKKTANVLVDRVKNFTVRANRCGGDTDQGLIEHAKRLKKRIRRLLADNITNTVLVCSDSICTKRSTKTVKRRVKQLSNQLYKIAKRVKIYSVSVCNTVHDPSDSRKRTEDYYKDLRSSINKLPTTKLNC